MILSWTGGRKLSLAKLSCEFPSPGIQDLTFPSNCMLVCLIYENITIYNEHRLLHNCAKYQMCCWIGTVETVTSRLLTRASIQWIARSASEVGVDSRTTLKNVLIVHGNQHNQKCLFWIALCKRRDASNLIVWLTHKESGCGRFNYSFV
jgi:hypothetical protein